MVPPATRFAFLTALLLGCVAVVRADAPQKPVAEETSRLDLSGDPLPASALLRLGTGRWRSPDTPSLIAFVAEGKEVLTVGQDGVARAWEAPTGRELRRFGASQRQESRVYFAQSLASPDGRYLAVVGGLDKTLRLWDVAAGKELWNVKNEGKSFAFRPLAFTPDSRQVLVEGTGAAMNFHEVATGKPGPTIERIGKSNLSNPVFSPDGKQLACRSSDGLLRLFDAETAKHLRNFGEANDAKVPLIRSTAALQFGPEAKTLMEIRIERDRQAGALGKVRLIVVDWDLETAKESRNVQLLEEAADTLFYNPGPTNLSPDGRLYAYPDAENTLHLLDLATGKEIRRLGDPVAERQQRPRPIFSPDGKSLAMLSYRRSGVGPTVSFHDIQTGKEIWKREQNLGFLVFAPDGKNLLAQSFLNTDRLQYWDANTGQEHSSVAGHRGDLRAVGLSPDGKNATTLAQDGFRRWDLATGQEQLRHTSTSFSQRFISALSPDGRSAAFADGVNNAATAIQLWDVATNKETVKIELTQAGLLGLGFSPDGQTLAVRAGDRVLRLYDGATGRERAAVDEALSGTGGGQAAPTNAVPNARLAFTPDGRVLASLWEVYLNDNTGQTRYPVIHLADARTGKSLSRLDLPRGMFLHGFAFAPDGRSLAVLTQNLPAAGQPNPPQPTFYLSLWESITGKERLRFTLPGRPTTLGYSPDGRTVAVGGSDGVIRLWAARTGKKLGDLTGHQGEPRTLVFSADGRRLVTGSADSTALVWDVAALAKPPAPLPGELDVRRVEALWDDLGSDDAAKAHKALLTLSAAPPQTTAFLMEHVKPAAGVEDKRLEQLLKELDGAQFAVRQNAEVELAKLGELAEPALQRALASKPSLEVRQRIEKLLDRLSGGRVAPELYQPLRSLEVLEEIGTPEARQLLEKLAKGAAGARLTREAEAALARLSQRSGD
jgi:WD40 repeat protein